MANKKCVFMGGKQIGVDCLNILLEKGIRPDVVIPNSDDESPKETWHDSLAKTAEAAGLEVMRGKNLREPEVLAKVKEINPDMIFCIGGVHIVPKEILAIPKSGTINIHPALLPKFRGRYSTVHALFENEKETGATLQFMEDTMDTGPIVSQKAFPITDFDTARTVYDKFTVAGGELFRNFVDLWKADRKIDSYRQDESKATTYPKGLPNDGKIDWSWDGKTIERFIRAMTFEPFPPADFKVGDKEMVIIDKKYFKGFM